MTNGDIEVAREFHDRTAHSYQSIRSGGHWLDWDVKPFLFKIYPDLPVLELPRAFDPLSLDTLDALSPNVRAPHDVPVTIETLASVLFYSAGLTKKRSYPGGGEVQFRAAPSTGALYQTEVYIVTGALDGLDAGVYHFSPGDFCLRRLRAGDHRPVVARAAATPDLERRPVTLVLSAIYWRNTWKYQARGYRHFFWDSGTMLANLTAAAGALGLTPAIRAGFVDAEVNNLLGLDPQREASLELVALGPTAPAPAGAEAPAEVRRPGPLDLPTLPLSSREVDYPLLRAIHVASALDTPEAVSAWRGTRGPEHSTAAATPPGVAAGQAERGGASPVALPPPRLKSGRAFGETVLRRGSTRQFSHDSLSALELSTVLFHATRVVTADFPTDLVALYLIVNAVEDIRAGAYFYRREDHGLELIREGDFRARSAYLCLEQPLGGDAAAVFYFLAPLNQILDRWGNRGYRLANLAAGLGGGRAYLAAYAQGFGASGLTFYDTDVVRFFEPHARGLDAIFVTALGRSARAHASVVQ
jgi:SagB-type dehydrogenase family enzyme